MDNAAIEKFASALGEAAVTGDISALQKEAYAPLIGGTLGAALGGWGGYMGSEKEKDKRRNALYGALIGALGGTGAGIFANAVHNPPAMPGTQSNSAAGGATSAPKDWTTSNVTNPLTAARFGVDAAAGLGGAGVTHLGVRAIGDRLGVGRDNELTRLMNGKLLERVAAKVRGKQTVNPYDAALKPLFEMARRGENVGAKLAPKLAPTAKPTAARERQIQLLNKTLEQPSWRNFFGLGPRASLGGSAAERAERATILEQASARAKSLGLSSSSIPKNTILTDLAKYRRPSWKTAPIRWGAPVAGGTVASILTDIFARTAQNHLAKELNAAPSPAPTPETPAK